MTANDPRSPALVSKPWRVGRKVGRTIYAQISDVPTDDDPLIGVMDNHIFAADVVSAHNSVLAFRESGSLPLSIEEALRLADRIETTYPHYLEREEAQDALVQLARFVRYDQQRLVCSWCGEDFEPGDWASTNCCSCDPVPASALPSLLKDARREAEEAFTDPVVDPSQPTRGI